MAAPIYMTPRYINFQMIEQLLRRIQVQVTTDPLDSTGMYIGQVNDYLAQGESYIIQTVLKNYVALPLQTIKGDPFDALLDNPDWVDTYQQIRATFIAMGLIYIYQNNYSNGGVGSNGEMIIEAQQKIVTNFTRMATTLDQASNLRYKNAFRGLKPCDNASQRIPKGIRVPRGMPTGKNQSDAAFNAIPDYKYTR